MSQVSAPGPALSPLGKVVLVTVVLLAVVGIVPPPAFAACLLLLAGDAAVACILFRRCTMTASIQPVAILGEPVPVILVHPGLVPEVRLSVDHDILRSVGSPRDEDRTTLSITAPRRGRYPALSVRGVLVGPLGLGCALRRWSIPIPADHTVVPRAAAAVGSRARVRPTAQPSELDDGTDAGSRLREYRAGDSLQAVHWAASARHGELLVRSGADAPRVVRMAVDPGRSSRWAEAVVSTAMSVGLEVLALGDELHVTLPVNPVHRGPAVSVAADPPPRAYRAPSLGGALVPHLASARVHDQGELAATLALAVSSTADPDGLPVQVEWPGSPADGHFDVVVRADPSPGVADRPDRPMVAEPGVVIDWGRS